MWKLLFYSLLIEVSFKKINAIAQVDIISKGNQLTVIQKKIEDGIINSVHLDIFYEVITDIYERYNLVQLPEVQVIYVSLV